MVVVQTNTINLMDYFGPVTLCYLSCTNRYAEKWALDAVPVECQMVCPSKAGSYPHIVFFFCPMSSFNKCSKCKSRSSTCERSPAKWKQMILFYTNGIFFAVHTTFCTISKKEKVKEERALKANFAQ